MSKLEELIARLCPDGVEYKAIGEMVDYEQPSRYIVNSTKYDDSYSVPVLTAGQTFILGYTNETEGVYEASKENPVIIFDDFTAAFKWVDFRFKVKSSAMKILTVKNDLTTIRYIFHVMGFLNIQSDEHKRLWISNYSQIKVPVPPLEVQREIVHILDSYTASNKELKEQLDKELAARQKQYEFYRDSFFPSLKNVSQKWISLGEVAKVTKLAGYEFTKYVEYSDAGTIIALRGLNVKKGQLILSDVKYIDHSSLNMLTRSKLYVDDMLFTYVGTIGEVALIDENDKYYLAPNVALIRVNKENFIPKYVMYYFLSQLFEQEQVIKLLQSSSMKNIPMEKIRLFKLPVVTLSEQQRIVDILDRFDALCNDITSGLPAEIEARKKQYEYYRDKLLTFKELKKEA